MDKLDLGKITAKEFFDLFLNGITDEIKTHLQPLVGEEITRENAFPLLISHISGILDKIVEDQKKPLDS